MRNYAIYTCSITIRVLVGFSVLIFAFKFDFPSFMVLILAILNDGTILTISKDHVKPSPYPNSWHLSEIFTYAIVYGIYLAASTIVFFAVIVKTTFFHDKFGVEQFVYNSQLAKNPGWNHPILHSIIYLQVSTISQALIFITRSHSFFFLERPSRLLVSAFIIAQLIATFIAVWANWTFTNIHGCGWTWAAIVWIWNIIWFFPLDFLKFALRAYFDPKQKQAIEESLATEPSTEQQRFRRQSTISSDVGSPPSRRFTRINADQRRSRGDALAGATARYYTPHTQHLSTAHLHRNFAKMLKHKNDEIPSYMINPSELRRFSVVQAHHASNLLHANNGLINHRTTTAM